MVFIRLEDRQRLGIEEIDSQHEDMVKLVNQLHDAMLDHADRTTLLGILSQLLECTRAHFSDEERLMEQHDFPELEKHKSEHNKLRQQLVDNVERYQKDELLLSYAALVNLKGWALNHVDKCDKPLGDFLDKRKES